MLLEQHKDADEADHRADAASRIVTWSVLCGALTEAIGGVGNRVVYIRTRIVRKMPNW
jgi:hypothetical protein